MEVNEPMGNLNFSRNKQRCWHSLHDDSNKNIHMGSQAESSFMPGTCTNLKKKQFWGFKEKKDLILLVTWSSRSEGRKLIFGQVTSGRESHLPERRLLSFILLLPCLGLSRLPLESSEPHESWGSSARGIWNADSTELTGEAGLQFPPRSYLKAQGAAIQVSREVHGAKQSSTDHLEQMWPHAGQLLLVTCLTAQIELGRVQSL